MCGIIGYLGTKSAKSYLLDGLKRMEYRGYDSSGIVIFDQQHVHLYKQEGKVQVLVDALDKMVLEGPMGIGHTRWATHGKPSDQNAHPHTDCKRQIFCVHNGVIENHLALRRDLEVQGHHFTSETDSEVIVHLIESFYQNTSLECAVRKMLPLLQGSYAIAVTSTHEPNKIVVARKESPLMIGMMEDGLHLVASDVCALLGHTKKLFFWKMKKWP